MRDLETGIVYVNAPTIGAEIQLPFGGTKGTGNGHREAGTAAIDFYSEWKTLYIDYSDRLQRAQIDPGIWRERMSFSFRQRFAVAAADRSCCETPTG